MRTLGLIACGLCVACFSKPSDHTGVTSDAPLEDAEVDAALDAPQPAPCSTNSFSAPTVMTEFDDSLTTAEPTITGDLQQIFFTKGTGGPDFEVHYATRDVPAGLFSLRGKANFSTSNSMAPDPSITADGLMIVHLRAEAMGARAYVATRSSPTGSWSAAALLAGLESEQMGSLDISWDGLVLYFWDENNQLRYATRSNRNAPFQKQGLVIGGDLRFPTLSADGLELFYNDNTTVRRHRRTSVTMAFPSTGATTYFTTNDPDLSADGTTIVVAKQNARGLMMATRACN